MRNNNHYNLSGLCYLHRSGYLVGHPPWQGTPPEMGFVFPFTGFALWWATHLPLSLSRSLCLFVVAHEAQHSTAPVAGQSTGVRLQGSACFVMLCCCTLQHQLVVLLLLLLQWREVMEGRQSYRAIIHIYKCMFCNLIFLHGPCLQLSFCAHYILCW